MSVSVPVPCSIASGTLNYDSMASLLSGCVFMHAGCTDSAASNYVAAVNTDECALQPESNLRRET